jgi:hypothetical protein
MVVFGGAVTVDASAFMEFELAGIGRWFVIGLGRDSRG